MNAAFAVLDTNRPTPNLRDGPQPIQRVYLSRCRAEADELPDFTALTCGKLQKEMDLRKIPRQVLTKKAQYVAAPTNHLVELRHQVE
jgi:hypothetical protein